MKSLIFAAISLVFISCSNSESEKIDVNPDLVNFDIIANDDEIALVNVTINLEIINKNNTEIQIVDLVSSTKDRSFSIKNFGQVTIPIGEKLNYENIVFGITIDSSKLTDAGDFEEVFNQMNFHVNYR